MTDERPTPRPELAGENHPRAKLTLRQVLNIPLLRAAGLSQQEIAERLGVSQVQISRIERGERWAGCLALGDEIDA